MNKKIRLKDIFKKNLLCFQSMAGLLKTYEMPNLSVSAKKRERTDVQDEMWKNAGLTPIGGEEEETDAKEALISLTTNEEKDYLEKEFLEKVAAAIASREEPEGGETKAWTRVEDTFNSYMKLQSREAFEELKRSYSNFVNPVAPAVVVITPPPLQKKKNTSLLKLMDFAQDALKMGIFYLDTFIGMVATRLADRNVNVYFNKRMPLNLENVDTIEEFIRKNTHLGEPFLEMLLSQYRIHDPDNDIFKNKEIEKQVETMLFAPMPAKIESDINATVFINTGNFLHKILGKEGEVGIVMDEKRQWVFNVLDLAALSQILTEGSLGAVTMACAQIQRIPNCARFTLKQLLMSDGVRDVFAIFVAFQYQLASGGNAYAGRASTQGNVKGTTFMLSAGIETRKMLSNLVVCAQDWFRDVYEIQNPLYAQIKAQINAKKQEVVNLIGVDPGWKTSVDNSVGRPDVILLFESIVQNAAFAMRGNIDQTYLKTRLDILRREQFLNGIPEKLLKHVN
jgi:hypothetical protein